MATVNISELKFTGHSDSYRFVDQSARDNIEGLSSDANSLYNELFGNIEDTLTFSYVRLNRDNGESYSDTTNRVGISYFKYVLAGTTITMDDTNHKFTVAHYRTPKTESFIKEYYTGMLTGSTVHTVPIDCYIKFSIGRTDNADIEPSEASHVVITAPRKLRQLDMCLRTLSPMYKNPDYSYGHFRGWYSAPGTSYAEFNGDTTTAEVYAAYDQLMNDYSGMITKTDLGVCSDGTQHLYSYKFRHGNSSLQAPKIIITSGVHGYEKCSVFGLYYFLRDMLSQRYDDLTLEYICKKVQLIVIPIVNPYGFDNSSAKNANGININRNYDYNFVVYDSTDDYYADTAPFTQPESKAVRDVVLDNLDALHFVDFHTAGGTIDAWKIVNWISLHDTNDPFYDNIRRAACRQNVNITDHFREKYNLTEKDSDTQLLGYWTANDQATAKSWACSVGVAGVTLEGCNNFPGGETYTADVQKANSEIIGNWLMSVIGECANSPYR